MSKQSEILEGVHYSILEKWVANGKVDQLPEGMEEYMQHLTAVLGWHNRSFTKTQIIKRLRATFDLDYSQAKSRFIDGLNFFYLDNDVKYDAYMGIYADKLDQIRDLIIQTATTPEEALLAVKPIVEASKLREKIKPKESVSEDFYRAPFEVYTTSLPELGVHEPINRNELARVIDAMEKLDETEKIKVKQEAGVDLGNHPRQLFTTDEQEKED
ncbi:hypothetical protein [Tenacibaculum soleae]|uniref:hypothetical protein n=1 Tax=Tenacibaculum soleae TaxID=447689 RepID=UPI002301AAFB|nr:hypothetical protein [Tenacibaculum soleae]